MLKFLLELEYAETTKELVVMDSPGFARGGKLKIPSGTNALMIAIVRKQIKAIDTIVDFLNKNELCKKKIIGNVNMFN